MFIQLLLIFYAINLTVAELFCPKYHFATNSSCLMFFLGNETFETSASICKNYSSNLVTIEDQLKWNELIYQLNYFMLSSFEFRLGLFGRDTSSWYWIEDKVEDINKIHWCKSNYNLYKAPRTGYCTKIILSNSSTDQWCIQMTSCDDMLAFICEWKPTAKINQRLGSLLNSLFFCYSLLSVISLLLMLVCLCQFYCFEHIYIKRYVQNMNELGLDDQQNLVYFKKLI